MACVVGEGYTFVGRGRGNMFVVGGSSIGHLCIWGYVGRGDSVVGWGSNEVEGGSTRIGVGGGVGSRGCCRVVVVVGRRRRRVVVVVGRAVGRRFARIVER
jgi:hypothetical protein